MNKKYRKTYLNYILKISNLTVVAASYLILLFVVSVTLVTRLLTRFKKIWTRRCIPLRMVRLF